jgi:hypothetical protein
MLELSIDWMEDCRVFCSEVARSDKGDEREGIDDSSEDCRGDRG